jgi:putative aldouronate transport system permease protein
MQDDRSAGLSSALTALDERRKGPQTAPAQRPTRRGKLSLAQRIRRDWVMLLLILPGLLFFVVFQYLPLLGNIVAFENYLPFVGFINSPWVGWDNFAAVFTDPSVWQAIANTLILFGLQLVLFFPAPIALALLLNSLAGETVKRFVQSVIYLPHFIGWVIIVSICQQILGGGGVLPHLLGAIGLPQVNLMTSPGAFKWLLVGQVVWKDSGWGTIIFLAALLNIDPTLYEAARVDGAGRARQLWHVTLPGITGIIILLLILRLGTVLTVGFEQIILQRDNVGPAAGEVLDTWVYFHGLAGGQWGEATAVGLVKLIVGAALIVGANRVAHLFGQDGLYR